MIYQGIIFDLDGVIVFTDKLHYQAWKKMADEEGIYFDEKINNQLRGVSRMDSLEIILKRAGKIYSAEEKKELAERKNSYYHSLLEKMTPEDVRPETRKAIEELRRRGYKTAIGSSSKNTKFILAQTKIADLFDAVCDGNDISRSKPDPEVFLKAAEYLYLKPASCVIMEDAFAGIQAGIAGGFKTIAIGEAVKGHNSTYSVEKFEDILSFLK
jgi:beta-phosphoglucomutase